MKSGCPKVSPRLGVCEDLLVNGTVWKLDSKERFGFQSLNCHIRVTQILHCTVIE